MTNIATSFIIRLLTSVGVVDILGVCLTFLQISYSEIFTNVIAILIPIAAVIDNDVYADIMNASTPHDMPRITRIADIFQIPIVF